MRGRTETRRAWWQRATVRFLESMAWCTDFVPVLQDAPAAGDEQWPPDYVPEWLVAEAFS